MLLNDRHYVCIHKLAKQHAEASFTQVNDPLTGQLYFPSPIYLVGSAKMLAAAYRQKCTLLSRAAVPKLFGLRTPFAVKYFSRTTWRPGQYKRYLGISPLSLGSLQLKVIKHCFLNIL